jgi:hypothetical protein
MPLTIPSTAWSSAQSSKAMMHRLAAELERQLGAGAGEFALDRLARLGRAREGDLVEVGMLDEMGAVEPSPVMMLTTPAGSSAWRQMSARSARSAASSRRRGRPCCRRQAPARSSREHQQQEVQG